MERADLVRFALGALAGHRLRSVLSALGVAIGVAAVVLLTALGEGTRRYIVGQFSQFGTNLMEINPGKVKTFGFPGAFGGTTNKLTMDDAMALEKVAGVGTAVPFAFGQARVEAVARGSKRLHLRHDARHAGGVARRRSPRGASCRPWTPTARVRSPCWVPKLARELFGEASPLGQRVRIGSWGFLVIGVMESKGQLLGFDVDDSAYIPVASALDLFNQTELLAIDVVARDADAVQGVVARIKAALTARHRDNEDFTVTTQTEMLDTFGRIIGIITAAVTAIAGISLFVGAIGILTIMWISVHERTGEIGLLRALGVSAAAVQRLFLLEATALAVAGGVAGVAIGFAVEGVLHAVVPGLPLATPPEAVVAALAMSLLVGIAAGVIPARRAAALDPVDALRAE